MATFNLSGAEQQLIRLLRDSEPSDLQLTIYRTPHAEWEIEMSFDDQDSQGRTRRRRGTGNGSTFDEAWDDLLSGR